MHPEYRIVEIDPYTFRIDVKVTIHKGWWFWRKEVIEWREANTEGEPFGVVVEFPSYVTHAHSYCPTRCGHFTNRAAATRAIQRFQNHNVINNNIKTSKN